MRSNPRLTVFYFFVYDTIVSKKLLGALVIVLLGLGLLAVLMGVQRSTENRQHASSIFEDINTAGDIEKTNNADGTMGPSTWLGNFSNTLPGVYLGSLSFGVTDPQQGRMPQDRLPLTPSLSTQKNHTEVSPAEAGNNNRSTTTPTKEQGIGGPQSVSSLMVTIWKVEVHLARLGIAGARNTIEPTHPEEKPTGTPSVRDNRDMDKWETLNIGVPKVIDLVSLVKNHDVASLGITKLANGQYTEIRLYLSTASATLSDGTKIALTIPGRANTVRTVEPFSIDSGKTTVVVMDFDAQNSVIKAGETYILKPVVIKLDQKNQD